jgi:hypothetical protein
LKENVWFTLPLQKEETDRERKNLRRCHLCDERDKKRKRQAMCSGEEEK